MSSSSQLEPAGVCHAARVLGSPEVNVSFSKQVPWHLVHTWVGSGPNLGRVLGLERTGKATLPAIICAFQELMGNSVILQDQEKKCPATVYRD